ncbi:MAG: coenzyme F420-0:L-glutamate ligase [Thermoproteota archaeon]|nr:coenzyme F420-0:L-glutamate ligase [Thermoproteota archaeon]
MKLRKVSILCLEGFPLIKKGDDLAKLIVETAEKNGVRVEDGDVLVVAQKIVSKAEGRVIKLSDVVASDKAKKIAKITGKDSRFVELVLRETKKIVKASHETLIVKDVRDIVCINAGIDKSNVSGGDSYALLPKDPDESARRIRSQILKITGKKVAVVICDTSSRPFRRGQVEFAIGLAGLKSFRDYRGQEDLFRYRLKVKNVAVVDEIACAAELIMGQGKERIPVVIIKNLRRAEPSETSSIKELVISKEEDLFKGTL